jgi:predicted RNA binding protein YcfA (HicA-like mRNA interferase family)
MRPRELLRRISRGHRNNVDFNDFARLLRAFGFVEARSEGSHRIFIHEGSRARLSLQSQRGEAKPYQIEEFLKVVDRYDLNLEGE